MEPSPWDPEGIDPVLDPQGRVSPGARLEGIDLRDLFKKLVAARALDVRLGRAGIPAWAPAAGEEAVAAAVIVAAAHHDWIHCGHRDVAISFLRGVDGDEFARQCVGAADGAVRGAPGAVGSLDLRVAPPCDSLAMHLAIAAGRAQGQRLAQPGHVTIAVCGEGVTTTGVFHETLALAVARDLPLVIVCKSQLWPEGAPAEAGVLGDGVAERARSAGMWARRVDGADAVGTLLAVQAAVTRAREGSGPSVVEVIVTQLRHDPPAHRDPVERMRLHLDQQGQWSQTFQDVVEAEPRTRLDRAFKALGLGSP